MTEEDFVPDGALSHREAGRVCWKAPSNIALVKYWGKKKEQVPANASLSFTLDAAASTTSVTFEPIGAQTGEYTFEFFLDGVSNTAFRPKIHRFFTRIEPYFPVLRKFHYTIATSNSFPHSSGIASSASGMAALAACFTEIEERLSEGMDREFFEKKASFLARLGSGSACRSIRGRLVEWGSHPEVEGSSDLYGIPYPFEVHSNYNNYRDTILLVDTGEKQVSSSEGHALMNRHVYAEQRFAEADKNIEKLRAVFREGDLQSFADIVEHEALALHAMMMTSNPSFMLMKPNTLKIIELVRDYRKTTGIPLCFTLDAGPNVHLLYPEWASGDAGKFIEETLVGYCQNGQYLCDGLGNGVKRA